MVHSNESLHAARSGIGQHYRSVSPVLPHCYPQPAGACPLDWTVQCRCMCPQTPWTILTSSRFTSTSSGGEPLKLAQKKISPEVIVNVTFRPLVYAVTTDQPYEQPVITKYRHLLRVNIHLPSFWK